MRPSALTSLARNPLQWLLLAFPLALVLELTGAGELPVFLAAVVAIVPLAGWMGKATESLAASMGPALGGFLNATFGNAAELIIGIAALLKGPHMYPLVKASLTGSIMGNFLLVAGASILAGGLKHERQTFKRASASMGATLLALAAVGLLVPTVYHSLADKAALEGGGPAEHLSEEIAVVLLLVYLLSLLFSLVTHREHFSPPEPEHAAGSGMGRRAAILVLLLSTAAIAILSELLAGSVEVAASSLGLNRIFVGAIVLAIIGNAAEHSTAVVMAMKNRMDLSLQISIGSGTQIALFVAPVFVFSSLLMGHARAFDLHFSPLEVFGVVASVLIVDLVAQDGETNWLEGAMLLAVYVVFALAFYHFPYPMD